MTSNESAAQSTSNILGTNSNNHTSDGHHDDNAIHLQEEDEDEEMITSEAIMEESSRSSSSSLSPGSDSSTRRRRILLGVLFRLLVRGRDSSTGSSGADHDSDDDDDDEDGMDQGRGREYHRRSEPTLPLRSLSETEAASLGATCRICFEGPSSLALDTSNDSNMIIVTDSSSSSGNNNPLIAPCNCSGGSEWIHKQCLRQWQRHAVDNCHCNVCQCRYSLRPPRARDSFFAGNLLVYMDESSLSGTFSKTIVLLLKHDAVSTFGLIINSPLQQRHKFPLLQQQHQGTASTTLPSCFRPEDVSWRRGGPVCGGRLGLVRYVVAHTLPLLQAGEEEEGTSIGEAFVSRPTLLTGGGDTLQFVYERDDPSSPVTVSESDLPGLLESLASRYEEQYQQQQQQQSRDDASSSSSTTAPPTGRLFLFGGYSQWGRGQLSREVQRGSWGVCEHGTLEDVLRPMDNSYYDELTQNNPYGRLLTGTQLFQADE